MLALDHLRVVDFTRYLSGPTLTMLLGDLGADVIKVETLGGDPARQSGPFHESESVYYLVSNRNKRSIATDLRHPDGKEIAYRLIDRADVFVQNFRPGVAEAMGFGYEELRARNEALVYCNISGFGMESPGADFPGFDQTAQAMSGLMSVTGTDATGPLRAGIAVADSSTGVFAAVGVLAAIVERERTGRGQRVDTSLLGTMLTLMSYQSQKYLSLKQIPGQHGNDHPLMFPQGTFPAKSGVLTLASGNERMFASLCGVLGLDHLVGDPRFEDNAARMANRVELRRLIEEALELRPAEEWVPVINDAGVPCSPVLDVAEALDHPFTAGLDMVATVEHPTLGDLDVLGQSIQLERSREGWLRHPPPLLGEHSVEICRELGYDEDRIRELLDESVLRQPAAGSPGAARQPGGTSAPM
jgi:crotonobetainyl-CoA:carnitine CoA-transferase CaiB-like acyl-CoA transferase